MAGGARPRLLHPGEMARNVDVIVYPEHVTEEELDDFLDDLGVKCCRSPLHDRDVYDRKSVRKWERNHPNPTEEELGRKPKEAGVKKPHWHVYLELPGRRKQENLLRMLRPLGVKSVMKSNDGDHSKRYMCHLDTPNKVQYDKADIRAFGGINMDCLDRLDKRDRANGIAYICDYIKTSYTVNFFDLTNWVLEQEDVDLFELLTAKTAFFTNYMGGMLVKMQNRHAESSYSYKDLED